MATVLDKCPRCKAPRGELCHRPNGREMTYAHNGRMSIVVKETYDCDNCSKPYPPLGGGYGGKCGECWKKLEAEEAKLREALDWMRDLYPSASDLDALDDDKGTGCRYACELRTPKIVELRKIDAVLKGSDDNMGILDKHVNMTCPFCNASIRFTGFGTRGKTVTGGNGKCACRRWEWELIQNAALKGASDDAS